MLTRLGNALTGIYFQGDIGATSKAVLPSDNRYCVSYEAEEFEELTQQLDEYFAGQRQLFQLSQLVLQPRGTAFQTRVWQELLRIPFGETISYGELARRIGQPSASRAVGLANGRNPISILIPCHRVIGASGKLVGYGGGLDRKRRLLEIESPTKREWR